MTDTEHYLVKLFTSLTGKTPVSVTKLPGSGSYRSYFRLVWDNLSIIGAHNDDVRENDAFISFTNHFHREGLAVPELLSVDRRNGVYLLTDLGDTTLFKFLNDSRASEPNQEPGHFPAPVIEFYKKALAWLPLFQVKAGKTIDFSACYPRKAFDRQSMMWDLTYFKYYYLKLARIGFDEQTLEDDFNAFCDLLLKADRDFFMFRDFQSRNIMVRNGEPWFIDYQGGRKGALQYDIASLLYDGKADIPESVRLELLTFYLDCLELDMPVNRERFLESYYGFVLIRILQALGAYGFRGLYEKKSHFLQSIPFAMRNLRYLRSNKLVDFGLGELMAVIDRMVEHQETGNHPSLATRHKNYGITSLQNLNIPGKPDRRLTVAVHSFSYKKQVPPDDSGNGGGFVFDCRALPNPGRFEEYMHQNGKDQPVIDFLSREPEVGTFLDNVFSLVDQAVTNYISREFDHLAVSFGCTGGQHRSVYCAERLADHLRSKFDINVTIVHVEQGNKN